MSLMKNGCGWTDFLKPSAFSRQVWQRRTNEKGFIRVGRWKIYVEESLPKTPIELTYWVGKLRDVYRQEKPALFVTPLNHYVYLISRIIVLSAIGFSSALAMVLTAKGTSVNFLHFSVGAFSTCILFCLTGIFLISYTTEFLHFPVRAVPLLIFMRLPLLNYFELTNLSFLKLFPGAGRFELNGQFLHGRAECAGNNFRLFFNRRLDSFSLLAGLPNFYGEGRQNLKL